jgi:alanine racemase
MNEYSSSFNSCHVDLGALVRNYQKIADYSKNTVMAVIKGDAYGHGLIPCGQALTAAGCDQLGVLDLEEALSLKTYGLTADITVLAGLYGPIQSLKAVEAGLVVMAYDLEQINTLTKAAGKLNTKARIRLKIDTGMGRLGLPWEKAADIISNLATAKDLELVGLATHLATNGDQGAKKQLDCFYDLGEKTKKYFSSPLFYSVLASGGILAHQDFPDNLSRAGLLLYGYSPLDPADLSLAGLKEANNLIKNLEPVMTVKSRLIQVREAKVGETISYDRTFMVPKAMKFGTAPIGYVHGLSRTRSSQGYALICGHRADLLGRVCMNLTMYDLAGLSAEAGDEVVLLGSQGDEFIGADLFGCWQETSAYEILCHLGRSNPRVYNQSPVTGA